MTKDERIAELEARVAQLEHALGDEGRMLDEAAREREDLVRELERVARAGETPIETLRRILAEPTDEELAEEAARFADERIVGETRPTTPADIEDAIRIYHERDYDPLTTWGGYVQGFIAARREGRSK